MHESIKTRFTLRDCASREYLKTLCLSQMLILIYKRGYSKHKLLGGAGKLLKIKQNKLIKVKRSPSVINIKYSKNLVYNNFEKPINE